MKKQEKVRLGLGVSLAFFLLFSMQNQEKAWKKTEDMKCVALTYDDGPCAIYTEALLQVLEKEGVSATFFVMGKQAETYPGLVKKIHDGGHLLGNHTFSHCNVCEISCAEAEEEIKKTNELLYRICGEYPVFFRPPFGCNKEEMICNLQMYQVFWDVDPKDWQVQNTASVVNHVLKQVQDGDIILMHDQYQTTVEATEILIPKLRERGFCFVTVEQLVFP